MLMLLNSYSNLNFECGTDEAGRGCLAGPVTAAALILPEDFLNELLNDSKALRISGNFLFMFLMVASTIVLDLL